MKSFFKEFKDFAIRGNVVDMAVGVIIGGAFGTFLAGTFWHHAGWTGVTLTGVCLAGTSLLITLFAKH